MAATCTDYYAENGISSLITMQIVNVIYGFVCLEGQGIRISQNKTHLKCFFALLIVKRPFQTNSYFGDVYIISVEYIFNGNSKYILG